jgi:hypothetical protein
MVIERNGRRQAGRNKRAAEIRSVILSYDPPEVTAWPVRGCRRFFQRPAISDVTMMKLASRPMTATLVLLTFTLAADPVPKVAPEPLPPEPKSDPTNVRELYDAYRYYGLPLPPKGSYLGKKERKVEQKEIREKRTGKEDEYSLALIRNEKDKLVFKDYRKVEPPIELIQKNDIPGNMTVSRWIWNCEWLIFAAQAHHLGWKDAAQFGWEKGTSDPDYYTPEDSKTRMLDWLKATSWHHQRERLLEPDSDRRAILKTMRRTLLPIDKEFLEIQILFHKDLERTVRLDWNRRGTPDDVIDGIVHGSKTQNDLLVLGFDAVPAMIRHLYDDRLTRTTAFGGFNNSSHIYSMRISDICSEILQELSGREVDRFSVFKEREIENSILHHRCAWEANEWYQRAMLYGERKWCVNYHSFEYEDENTKSVSLNKSVLHVLREKYPEELPALVTKFKHRVDDGRIFLMSIVESRLTKDQKLDALRDAEGNPNAWHPLDVVLTMNKIDAEASRTMFATILGKAVRTGKLNHLCRRKYDTTILDCLHEFHDPEFWKQYKTLLPRFETTNRFEMIVRGFRDSEGKYTASHKKERLACLLQVLEDQTPSPDRINFIVDGEKMNPATIGYRAIVVLAREFNIEVPMDPRRSAADWAALREQVRVAAEKAIAKE